MGHLSREQLEGLAMGTVSRHDSAVRAHVSSCGECARLLTREARLELELYQAVSAEHGDDRDARGPFTGGWKGMAAWSAAAMLALAVGGAWLLRPRAIVPEPALDPGAVTTAMESAPCWVDPRTLSPGYDVLNPRDLCRFVTTD